MAQYFSIKEGSRAGVYVQTASYAYKPEMTQAGEDPDRIGWLYGKKLPSWARDEGTEITRQEALDDLGCALPHWEENEE